MKALAALALAALAFAAAACTDSRSLRPPPFNGEAARFLFPTGLALTPEAPGGRSLVVANAAFNREFDRGTILQVDVGAFDEAAAAPGRRLDLAKKHVLSSALVDLFAGELAMNADGSAAYVASRLGALNRVPIEGGLVKCPGSPADCSTNAVDLLKLGLEDPFAVKLASLVLPGASTPTPVVLVSHLAPVSTGSDAGARNALLAVVPEPAAGAPAQGPFSGAAFTVDIGRFGTSAIAVKQDPATDTPRVFLGGCYERVDPRLVLACSSAGTTSTLDNPLREVPLGLGASAAVQATNLGRFIGGGDTADLALSSDGTRLYVATFRSPNNGTGAPALLVVDLPAPGPRDEPVLVASVPLANQPNRIAVVPRASGDLVVVTATESDAVLVVDPELGSVVSQVQPAGDGPWGLASMPTATGDRVFVSLFNGCGVAAIDIPSDRPFAASLAGIVGGCP